MHLAFAKAAKGLVEDSVVVGRCFVHYLSSVRASRGSSVGVRMLQVNGNVLAVLMIWRQQTLKTAFYLVYQHLRSRAQHTLGLSIVALLR